MINVIPAIDIIGGRCVRLTQGDYTTQKVYDEDPLAIAKKMEGGGCKYLHLVDLDGALSGTMKNSHVLKAITDNTSLIVDYSGGIRTGDDMELVFGLGAEMVCIGSMAYKQPDAVYEWGRRYGYGKLVISADVRDGYILSNAWQNQTALKMSEFIENFISKGFNKFCCTDVSRDGMLCGVDVNLYKQIKALFPDIDLIASGGVASIPDIVALQNAGCTGVIVGKAIYEGNISLEQLKQFVQNAAS